MALLVAGCASGASAPELDEAELRAEAAYQKRLAIEQLITDQQTLHNAAFALLTAATEFCEDRIVPRYGFALGTRHSFGGSMTDAAAAVLGLGDAPQILSVVRDSPAGQAGLRRGDVIAAVDGRRITAGPDADETVIAALRESGFRPVTMTLAGDNARTIAIRPVGACDIDFEIVPAGKVNAYAVADTIRVTRGMMWFVRDETELALVVSHELAHHILGHTKLLTIAFTDATQRETDADYVGLYIMARAGYDIADAPLFWRRVAAAFPHLIDSSTSHPVMPYRFVVLRKTTEEIRRREAHGLPLVPERVDLLGFSAHVE